VENSPESNDKRTDAQKELEQDLVWMMSSKSGRRVLRHILVQAGYWGAAVGQGHETTEFLCGMRQVGVMIYNDLERLAFNQLLLLLKERNDDARANLEDSSA
jgi:hypothetical protein